MKSAVAGLKSDSLTILVCFVKKLSEKKKCLLISFLASGNFCHLLKTFAKNLDPDQLLQHVSPDLDPNCLIIWY